MCVDVKDWEKEDVGTRVRVQGMLYPSTHPELFPLSFVNSLTCIERTLPTVSGCTRPPILSLRQHRVSEVASLEGCPVFACLHPVHHSVPVQDCRANAQLASGCSRVATSWRQSFTISIPRVPHDLGLFLVLSFSLLLFPPFSLFLSDDDVMNLSNYIKMNICFQGDVELSVLYSQYACISFMS